MEGWMPLKVDWFAPEDDPDEQERIDGKTGLKQFLDSILFVKSEVEVELAPVKMAEGAFREVYRMRVLRGEVPVHLEWDPDRICVRDFVVKFQKKPSNQGRAVHLQDCKAQHACRKMTRQYNACQPPKKMYMLPSHMLKFRSPNGEVQYASTEPFVEGKYVKWTNNLNYIRSIEDRHTPTAFQHFTYEASGRRMMVCDIQGTYISSADLGSCDEPSTPAGSPSHQYSFDTDEDSIYVLTDPAIHSLEGRVGTGDMGASGIDLFFNAHQCNSVCRAMKLPDRSPQPPNPSLVPYSAFDEASPRRTGGDVSPRGRVSSAIRRQRHLRPNPQGSVSPRKLPYEEYYGSGEREDEGSPTYADYQAWLPEEESEMGITQKRKLVERQEDEQRVLDIFLEGMRVFKNPKRKPCIPHHPNRMLSFTFEGRDSHTLVSGSLTWRQAPPHPAQLHPPLLGPIDDDSRSQQSPLKWNADVSHACLAAHWHPQPGIEYVIASATFIGDHLEGLGDPSRTYDMRSGHIPRQLLTLIPAALPAGTEEEDIVDACPIEFPIEDIGTQIREVHSIFLEPTSQTLLLGTSERVQDHTKFQSYLESIRPGNTPTPKSKVTKRTVSPAARTGRSVASELKPGTPVERKRGSSAKRGTSASRLGVPKTGMRKKSLSACSPTPPPLKKTHPNIALHNMIIDDTGDGQTPAQEVTKVAMVRRWSLKSMFRRKSAKTLDPPEPLPTMLHKKNCKTGVRGLCALPLPGTRPGHLIVSGSDTRICLWPVLGPVPKPKEESPPLRSSFSPRAGSARSSQPPPPAPPASPSACVGIHSDGLTIVRANHEFVFWVGYECRNFHRWRYTLPDPITPELEGESGGQQAGVGKGAAGGLGLSPFATLAGHEGHITSLSPISEDGCIFSGSADMTIRKWDVHTGLCLSVLRGHGHNVLDVLPLPRGEHATLLLQALRSGRQRNPAQPQGVLTSPGDGEEFLLLSCSADRSWRIWEGSAGECLCTNTLHLDYVDSILLGIPHPGERPQPLLWTMCLDGEIACWDLAPALISESLTENPEA